MSQKDILKIHIAGQSGSGKGTQRKFLAETLELPSVSMGDLLRQARMEDNERARIIREATDAGVHVDNQITNDLIMEWIAEHGSGGYILEGYPRNRGQFEFFEETHHFTHVIALIISDEEVRTRINGRRICDCGQTYHMTYKPPQHDETCDVCGEKLHLRYDSSEEATDQRIALYHKEMEPLFANYREQGILHEIDGSKPIVQVRSDIAEIFN